MNERGAKHLFLAAPAGAFGEVATGLLIARELVAQGDHVIFLATSDLAVLFQGGPVRFQPIDDHVFDLRRVVMRLIERERCASLTLVDVTSLYLTLDLGAALDFLQRLPVPVIALDFWNLREAGLEWDFGEEASAISPKALAFERRLLPVPIARPSAGKGVFDALPHIPPTGAAARETARAKLGLGDDDRLIVWPTSRWQVGKQNWTHHERLARLVPERIIDVLSRLGSRIHVLEIGPRALGGWDDWGTRARWVSPVPPDRLHALLGAADLLLSLNTTATTNATAIAMGLPVVAVMSSHVGSVEQVTAALARPLSAEARAWLEQAAPLHAFRLWPLGLHRFLAPVLAGNPFGDAFRSVELLDEDALVETCRSLLFDPDARAREGEGQARYRETVHALPGPGAAFRAWL